MSLADGNFPFSFVLLLPMIRPAIRSWTGTELLVARLRMATCVMLLFAYGVEVRAFRSRPLGGSKNSLPNLQDG